MMTSGTMEASPHGGDFRSVLALSSVSEVIENIETFASSSEKPSLILDLQFNRMLK